MSGKYVDIIKRRVPEYYQVEGSDLMEYLEVCGEFFDELNETIKQHDSYNDYRHVPESRLTLLARKFAFNPPRGIPQSMMRGIVRDIASIYSSGGTEQALFWVFRLLGWGIRVEYVWLLNPERYDPKIKDIYSEYYESDGLESELSYENSVILNIGDGYEIGVEDQSYVINDQYNFSGHIKIGRNELVYTGDGNGSDPFSPRNPPLVTTDFNKVDYRNFVFGKERVENTGTYFYGRTPFSAFDNLRRIRIIGENYSTVSTRYEDVVMKTPYVMVTIDEADYVQFTQPYEDNGTEYNYTESEGFEIANILIDYFMTDTTRPSPIRVILTTGHVLGDDTFFISEDNLDQQSEGSDQSEQSDQMEGSEEEDYHIEVSDTGNYVIGTGGIHIGTPSFMPANSLSVIPMGSIGDSRKSYRYEIADDTYTITREFTEGDFNEDGFDDYVTDKIPVRTPSVITVTSSEDVVIQIRRGVTGSFSDDQTLSSGTEYILESNDVNYIRFKADDGEPSSITIDVEVQWESQVGYTLPSSYPSLVAA